VEVSSCRSIAWYSGDAVGDTVPHKSRPGSALRFNSGSTLCISRRRSRVLQARKAATSVNDIVFIDSNHVVRSGSDCLKYSGTIDAYSNGINLPFEASKVGYKLFRVH
jgi:hypothetical protein